MRLPIRKTNLPASAAIVAISAVAFLPQVSAETLPADGPPRDYRIDYLMSDGVIPSEQIDLQFKNGWGLASSATGPWWVSVNEDGTGAVVTGDGTVEALNVTMPGSPSGIVHSTGDGFVVTDGENSGPARFLFATEDGIIFGWNPGVGPAAPNQQAYPGVDHSEGGAVYKGLAIADTLAGARLYATDFHNRRVDVFDDRFKLVNRPGAFVDGRVPPNFAPFGIQTIGDRVFVTYAKQDAAKHDDVAGQGLGMIDVFDTEGQYISTVAIRGQLNAPWGIAMAPSDGFGAASGKLLVGNFGDGTIAVFTATDNFHKFNPEGVLRDMNRKELRIDGLWGIAFGNGGQAGAPNALYFAAGPSGEAHGSFGRVTLGPQ